VSHDVQEGQALTFRHSLILLVAAALIAGACSGGDITAPSIAWSRVAHDDAVFGGEGLQEMLSVTVGGPGLVAVGGDGPGDDFDAAVWTSPDGISWTRVAHDDAVFGGDGLQRMVSVTVGGPGLMAVGGDESGDDADAAVWVAATGS
jgi:hypothetical protein